MVINQLNYVKLNANLTPKKTIIANKVLPLLI